MGTPLKPEQRKLVKKPIAKKMVAPAAGRVQPKELPVRNAGEGSGYRSFVFYGRSGTGKTTVAATFPGEKLLLDIKDSGDDSVVGVSNLKVMDVRTWDDLEMTYWWLLSNPGQYQCIILDTLSQLQQLAIRKVLEEKNKDPDNAGEWGVMTMKEWGAVSSLMKTWIINFRDLPMNVVFIAQDRTFNSNDDGDEDKGLDPEVGPGLSPSIAKHLNAAVHVIGNTFIRSRTVKVKVKNPQKGKPKTIDKQRIEFCMRLGPNDTYITKARKPKHILLPSVLVNPTYDALVAIIQGTVQS